MKTNTLAPIVTPRINRHISQNGANLTITLTGSPEEVARELQTLDNYGFISRDSIANLTGSRALSDTGEREEVAAMTYGETVSVSSNLPRFERALRTLAVNRLRRVGKAKRKLGRGGLSATRKALMHEITELRSMFGKDSIPYRTSYALDATRIGGHGRAGDWSE